MGALALAVRGRLRRRSRNALGLVVLGGLGFGITLACLAGARRTDSAFDRFEAASRPGDLEIGFDEEIPFAERLALVERVQSLPQVARSAGASWIFHTMPGERRDALITIAALDDRFAHELEIPRVLEGRLPDPDRPDELFLNEIAADDLDLGVGDVIELETVPVDQFDRFFGNQEIEGDLRSFTVTGIARYPDDLEEYGGSGYAFLTPAYWDAHAEELAFFGPSIGVEVTPGQRSAFEAAAGEFLPPSAFTDPAVNSEVAVGDATRVQATALLLFALVVGAATVAFVTLAYSRQTLLGDEDSKVLHQLGMSRRHRWAVIVAPLVLAGVGATLLAVLVATAVSPLFPFGLAGRAEPDPGVHLDALVVLGGAAVALLVLAAIAGLVALVGLRRRQPGPSREWAVPAPLVVAIGLTMALNPGRGSRAVPVRSAIATATVGVALFVATLTFGQSLDRLVGDPERYGWNVDLITGTSDDPDNFEEVAPQIEADDHIGEWAVASVVQVTALNRALWVMGLEPVEGDIGPVIIEGRAPVADDEVALGRDTLSDLGLEVGDEVPVARLDGGDERPLRVVGVSVLPGGDHDFPGGLGEGGVMTLGGLRGLGDAPRHVYLARAAPGVDPLRMVEDYQAQGPGFYGPRPGPEIDNLDEASSIIPALVLSIALLGVVALGHALVVTVRRRRHDLALLGSLGLRPRQLMGVVLVQAVAIAAIALVIGIPVGRVAAGPAWAAAARELGVADDLAAMQVTDVVTLAAVVLVTNLALAAWPAWSAARTRVAATLRAE